MISWFQFFIYVFLDDLPTTYFQLQVFVLSGLSHGCCFFFVLLPIFPVNHFVSFKTLRFSFWVKTEPWNFVVSLFVHWIIFTFYMPIKCCALWMFKNKTSRPFGPYSKIEHKNCCKSGILKSYCKNTDNLAYSSPIVKLQIIYVVSSYKKRNQFCMNR